MRTPYAPQRRYSEKQKALGFTKVTVWVPEADRDNIRKQAEKIRAAHVEKNAQALN